MPITGEHRITLQEFVDQNLHFNFSRASIEVAARKSLDNNEDYRHIVVDTRYVISKASIEDYFIEIDAAAAEKEAKAAEADLKLKLGKAKEKAKRLDKKKADRDAVKT